jgi:phosphoribosyl 1,2-cyclic phosphodiesterase
VTVLGSGSSGNCTAVSSGADTLLVDAGFSAKEILRRLCAAGIDSEHVRAIVLTHEHTDHVAGVRVLAKRLGVPVLASPGTIRAASLQSFVSDTRALSPGEEMNVGCLEIAAFATSHDAAEPMGVTIGTSDGEMLGLATDTGVLGEEAFQALAACTLLAIETNHDERLLQNGPYPWFLKQRILSTRGHLSNDAAAHALERLAHDRVRAIIGMHASRTNNTAALAATSLETALTRIGLAIPVSIARQDAAVACTLT